MNPHQVTEDFEKYLAEYSNSSYAVAVDSCSNAIFLCLKWVGVEGIKITIPKHTYMSVPCQIRHAGATVSFKESSRFLKGSYNLAPTLIWDSALSFTKGMYVADQLMCLSFSGPSKILKLGKGGAILTDNLKAYEWFKRARYHGRNPIDHREDTFDMLGWNVYMAPEQAARGHLLLSMMKDNNEDQNENPPYPDLSKFEISTKE